MLVPNDFSVELSPADHERLTPFGDDPVRRAEHAGPRSRPEQRYTLAGPLTIAFARPRELGTGRFRVRSKTNAAVTAAPGQP